jgi:Tfp pilus assembly PilM family ATPase
LSKFIAIDLDPQGIYVASGSARAGHTSLDAVAAWDAADSETPPALTVETATQIGEQLRERLKAAGIAPAPALVSIPRDRVILKELRYPAVPLPEEPNVVKFQAMKELTDASEDIVLDYVPLSFGTTDGERRSMAVAVRKDLFNAIQALCTAANLKLTAVTPRPYCVTAGLTRAFATGATPRPEGREAIAILTLSPNGGEFTVIRPGATAGTSDVTFTRTITAPSLTSETELLTGVRRNLAMYAGANPGHPVQAVYVAEHEGRAVNRLKSALGIPVHAYDPLAGLTSTAPESNHGRFVGAVGLLAANALGELPINFVVPRQPKEQRDPKYKQIFLGAGVAALLVCAGLGYGLIVVNSAQNELARLQAVKAELEDDATRLEPDSKRMQAVNQWQSRRVVWLDMLYDTTDQFSHADGMVATKFTAKAVPPDQKTAKQDVQATIDISLTAHSPIPVNNLMIAMEADNTDPKTKYYQAVDKNIGSVPSGDSTAREYTVQARVTGRPPEQFTRTRLFSPPSRKNYPPPVAAPVEPKDTETAAKDKEASAKGSKDETPDEKDLPEPKDAKKPDAKSKEAPAPKPKGKSSNDRE